MKLIFFVFLIATGFSVAFAKNKSNAAPIRVAVIDTGFDFESNWEEYLGLPDVDGYTLRMPKLCKTGHEDFTNTGIQDTNGHGTHVAGIIAKFAENSNYCLIILKNYAPSKLKNNTLERTLKALEKAIALKVDIINYSGGGRGRSETECEIIRQALDAGIKVIVAAGNERQNINRVPYYPAMCDDRIVAVKNVDDMGNLASSSNFTDAKKGSRELQAEKGINILSLLPKNKIGMMTGTSQSAPTRTGKTIKKMASK